MLALPPRPFGPFPWTTMIVGGALLAAATVGLGLELWRGVEGVKNVKGVKTVKSVDGDPTAVSAFR